jgi:predicted AlkP superfamily phosphohydrolase/phosphomutase
VERAFHNVAKDSVTLLGSIYAGYLSSKYDLGYDTKYFEDSLTKFEAELFDGLKTMVEAKDIHRNEIKLTAVRLFHNLLRRTVFHYMEETANDYTGNMFNAVDRSFGKFGVKYEDGVLYHGNPYNPYERIRRLEDWMIPEENARAIRKEDIQGDADVEDDRYLELLEQLTRTLRSTLPDVMKTGYNFTVRFPEAIGFKGSNRIIAILEDTQERIESENGVKRIIKVHYGKAPADFEKQFKERMDGAAKLVYVKARG